MMTEQTGEISKPGALGGNGISLVECPRDAMQGWVHPISTNDKVEYLNALLRVGFDVLDFGSFVSAKAIPQLADTKDVIPRLQLNGSATRLLAIVANTRGAEEAVMYDEISFLGFPFSISETFQQRNTNKSIAESLMQVEEMQRLCLQHKKELVVYISMGFGNPYGDPYSAEVAIDWVRKLADLGIRTIAMSDTVGIATTETIDYIFRQLIPAFPQVNIGAHFHASNSNWQEKINTAYMAGCNRYDSALKGIGGCPMAKNELVGNIATENMIAWCDDHDIYLNLDRQAFEEAMHIANRIFL